MVERLNEIIELSLDLEPSEELGLAIRELMEEVVQLQLRVAELMRFIDSRRQAEVERLHTRFAKVVRSI